MTTRTDILFLSPMCLLDGGSGAARSIRTWLEVLAAAGYRCEALTMAVFEGRHAYPLEREIGRQAAVPENHGKWLRIEREGVVHTIFYTRSTTGAEISADEQDHFLGGVAQLLARKRPRVVIGFGSSSYGRKVLDLGRRHASRFLFYLANAEFSDAGFFSGDDLVVCPSEFLAGHYRRTLGLEPQVVPSVIKPDCHLAPGEGMGAAPERRTEGFVTFFNPTPEKGLTLFLRLVELAWRERPELTFLAVEGRLSRAMLRRKGIDPALMPNVWWLPNQGDVRRVYARTSVLLVPSYWREAAGRVAAEAQLSGIPVLAADRGGIGEQLNGGGFLFELPERCTRNYWSTPTADEVRPWLETIGRLMDEETAYADAVEGALRAARPFRWQARQEALVDYFRLLLQEAQ